MRNYSKVVKLAFLSYEINLNEYVKDVNVSNVLTALAKAFEVPSKRVHDSFHEYVEKGEFSELCSLTPSEQSVLKDLYDFVSKDIVDPRSGDGCTVFHYSNLNTGIAVSWAHIVI